ncbi:MAG: type I methionyl aminopeptidase [Bacteroidota bacterium]
MSIETDQDLQGIQQASKVVGECLREMVAYAKPGMSTFELDAFGNEILRAYGAQAAPKKEYGFPGWTCISVNDEAAHGIPSRSKVLQEGDLVNIDVSAELNGYYGDNGRSFILGEDKQGLQPLVQASTDILTVAISRIKGGLRLSALGSFIEKEARKRGFTTIKNLMGHGIGLKLHDKPHHIPNFNDRTNRQRFRKNTVVAVETFISTRARYVHEMSDGWTMKSLDGSFVAQHEHTLIVTEGQPMILTHNNGI